MDIANTEGVAAPAAEASAKSRSFKDWLKGFKDRFPKKQSPSGVSLPPSPLADDVSVPEAQPYKSKLDQKRETEKLSFAPRVFFHTTPNERVASITEHGLFGDKNDPNVSDKLGYSLYFGFEHTHIREDMSSASKKDPLKETPDNYVLTVWKRDSVLKKDSSTYFKQAGYRVIVGKPSAGEVPEGFYQATPMGGVLQARPEDVGKLSKDNFLSAIPLTKPVREEMVKLMILAQAGVLEADRIEEQVGALLKSSQATLKNIDYPELAHMLTVSLERSLMAGVMKPALERAKKSPKIRTMTGLVIRSDYPYGEPLKALWLAYNYRLNVNDKVSARYLDGAIAQLTKQVQAQGVNTEQLFQRFDQSVDQLKQGKSYDLRKEGYQLMDWEFTHNYYGGSTEDAAYWMMRNHQLGEFNYVENL